MNTIIPELVDTTIKTVSGTAKYLHTEVEDDNGNWNDNWWNTNGEYVRHEGRKHHVYIVRGY